MSDNINIESFGLLTAVWGPPTWDSLHCITFGYPEKPSDENKKDYFAYFKILSKVLPCCECREHYTEHISKGDTKLTPAVFESRDTLTLWLYNLHCAVNKKMGVVYDIKYSDLCKKYGSYVVSCEISDDQRKEIYKNAYNKEAASIPYNVAMCFVDYAKSRGLLDFEKTIMRYHKINRCSDQWIDRNTTCHEMIKKMRINGISSFEKEGEYKDLPTIDELQLMQCLSTSTTQKYIKKALIKLGYKFDN